MMHLHDIDDTAEYYYRFEAWYIHFEVKHCKVLRETPKGVWVEEPNGKKHIVYHDALKKYAYPTLEEAYNNFMKRRRKRHKLLQRQLEANESVLRNAKNFLRRMQHTHAEMAEERGERLAERIMDSVA